MAIHELLILALVVVLLWAAISDGLSFRIPNAVPIAIIGLYPLYLLAGGAGLPQVHWNLAIAIGTFLIGALLFARGWMGGGDVKLLSALALWAGPVHILPLVLMMSVAGGALALIGILLSRGVVFTQIAIGLRIHQFLPQAPRGTSGRRMIPYGIAIAIGGLHMCGQIYLAGVH